MRSKPAPGARQNMLAAALILLAGLGVRLYRLGAESLWYDETVSAFLAGSPVPELIRHTAGDIHPPGYYLLLRVWFLLTGYGDGRADALTFGLEWVSGFLSVFFGVLLIALVYSLGRRLADERVGLIAAAFVALSPFNIWYSQEVRMYTLGAVLGIVSFRALLDMVEEHRSRRAAVVYAVAAASGMFTLYYFAFLLIAINAWALVVRLRQRRPVTTILLANLAAALLYAPWIPVAFRQATQPPVPPWRAAPNLPAAILESWTALSLGQSAPRYLWPALVLTLALYCLGLLWLGRKGQGGRARSTARAMGLAVATVGPLALILLLSFATPLYHVRYLFTYSSAFYVVLAAGVVAVADALRYARTRGNARPARPWRSIRPLAVAAIAVIWLAAAAVTLQAFWFEPAYRTDDHRAAVRELEARWRPGDAVVVNAGWAYTALATYWTGEIANRTRITETLPEPREDAGLVMVTTGHTDGDPGLGWGDPRSDFFAMPAEVVKQQLPSLFENFRRVWHYRIYDTVNDPDGLVRALLPRYGQATDSRTYPGEAYMKVDGYVAREGVQWDEAKPGAKYANGLDLRFEPSAVTVSPGQNVYIPLTWMPATALPRVATSARLVREDGEIIFQPPDELPLGPAFQSTEWPAGVVQPQTVALSAPEGTPPGNYRAELVVYAADSGEVFAPVPLNGAEIGSTGLALGTVAVTRPPGEAGSRTALADFGPVALIEAQTPATVIAPRGAVPIELLWQSQEPADELVVVAQLLDREGVVAANLEEQPLQGRYPTSHWSAGELVRDRHVLVAPDSIATGEYRLIVGLYRVGDGRRLRAQTGLLTESDHYSVGEISVR